jgi:hypothetical protein
MKPGVTEILNGAAQTLAMHVAPHLTATPYAIGHVGTIGLMLMLAGQEHERGADLLVQENKALRALFKDAAQSPLSALLRRDLMQASERQDESLRISALEMENARLKDLLIALHEAAEETPHPWARPIEARIWAFLKESADTRAAILPIP